MKYTIGEKLKKALNIFIKPENRKHYVSAVVLAGGSGLRVGGDIAKQHIKLLDKEIIIHTLLAFESCPIVDEIVVVCREGEKELYNDYKIKYNISKISAIVQGGSTRRKSALCGFEALDKKCEYVIIHDGARCLITSEAITEVTKQAYRYRAAILAKAATDTLKIADERGFVEKTADRSNVYMAQTPQVFERELYRVIAYSAENDGVDVTDDSMLAERLGIKVKICTHPDINIKVTDPGDVSIAEILLNERNKTTS